VEDPALRYRNVSAQDDRQRTNEPQSEMQCFISCLLHRPEIAVQPGQSLFDQFVTRNEGVRVVQFQAFVLGGVPSKSNIGLTVVSKGNSVSY